jgi:hypothetical protein
MLKTASASFSAQQNPQRTPAGTPPVLLRLRPRWKAVLNILHWADAENGPPPRSRLIKIFNVPLGYASGFASPAALLESRFEHPSLGGC